MSAPTRWHRCPQDEGQAGGVGRFHLRSNDSRLCNGSAHSIRWPRCVVTSTAVSAAKAKYQLSQGLRFLYSSKSISATSSWIPRRRGKRIPLAQYAEKVKRWPSTSAAPVRHRRVRPEGGGAAESTVLN